MVNRTLPDFEWPACFSREPQQLTTHGQTEAQRRKVLKDGYHRGTIPPDPGAHSASSWQKPVRPRFFGAVYTNFAICKNSSKSAYPNFYIELPKIAKASRMEAFVRAKSKIG